MQITKMRVISLFYPCSFYHHHHFFVSFKYVIAAVTIMRVEINEYIVADSEICHGKPTFKGTRIMVWQVLEMLEDGTPVEEIITSFITPLTKEHIKAALHYAAELTKGKDNVTVSTTLTA